MQFSDLDLDLLVSEPRMDTYLLEALDLLHSGPNELPNGEQQRILAARLYNWDLHLAASLWPSIAFTEVVLRNAMNDHLCSYFGISPLEGWHTLVHNGETFISNKEEGARLKAKFVLLTAKDYEAFDNQLQKVKGEARGRKVTGDFFVGKVSLGIWISLLNDGLSAPGKGHLNYEQTLWEPCLKHAFPNFAGGRAQLRDELNRFARLRNRIAHHEHLIGKDVLREFDHVVRIARYVDDAAGTIISEHNGVRAAFDRKADFLRGMTLL